MSVREMKTSDLIIGLMGAHSWEGLYQSDFAAEIDRRFPVPVEREEIDRKISLTCRCGHQRTQGLKCCMCGYIPNALADVMFKDTGSRVKQEAAKARAESTGKACATCKHDENEHFPLVGCRRPDCGCSAMAVPLGATPPAPQPAPAAPTDEWVTIGELECGAVFETRDGIRAVKSEYRYSNAPHAQCLCVLVASGEYAHFDLRNEEPVRELRILAADEIAVRIDDATVDLIVAFMCPGYVSELSEAVREDYKFTARCILEALSKGGGGK